MLASQNPYPELLFDGQASAPSTPSSGFKKLFVRDSDGALCAIDSSGNVVKIDNLFTTPSDAGFSWVNQTGASLSTTDSVLTLTGAATGSGVNFQCRVKTAPATPWSAVFYVRSILLAKPYNSYGFIFRESGSGKIAVFDIVSGVSAASRFLRSAKLTNATTFSAEYQSHQVYEPMNWFKIEDNGSNRICSISPDGLNWFAYHTVTRTDFLTADQFGFCVAGENASTPNFAPIMNILSLKVS